MYEDLYKSRQILSIPGIRSRRSKPIEVTPVIEAIDVRISPLEAYLRLKSPGSKSFLFESAERGGKSAKFSFIASSPSTISVKDGRILVNEMDIGSYQGGPVAFLKDVLAGFKPSKPVFIKAESFDSDPVSVPVFFGGLAGYISYDFIRYFDNIGNTATDDLGCKDLEMVFVDDLVVFDHEHDRVLIISNAIDGDSTGDPIMSAWYRVKTIKEALLSSSDSVKTSPDNEIKPLEVKRAISKEQFMEMVRVAKEYILAGDAFQIVLSLRAEVEADIDPVILYQVLKEINPSPYMYLLEFGDESIVGSSPEILVKVEDRNVTVRPIAGTRPRGKTNEEDEVLEREMKADPKELAEHIMLVDLGRNDIGKVSKFGSVRVDDLMGVEKYSHVQHIVSNVVGELADDKDAIDVLTATFPAGTVSGAPKTRAMQIIEELEGVKRGLYAGCVGYFCFNSNTDLAIAIRTILIRNGKAYVQAGAGIVMDSIPENEYIESLNKSAAMIKALGRAIKGGKQDESIDHR